MLLQGAFAEALMRWATRELSCYRAMVPAHCVYCASLACVTLVSVGMLAVSRHSPHAPSPLDAWPARVTFVRVDRHDGFGAQLIARISCMLQASVTPGLYYAHTPFTNLEHEEDAPGLLARSESFINLGSGELSAAHLPMDAQFSRGYPDCDDGYPHCHGFANANAHLYALLRPTLRHRLFQVRRSCECNVFWPQ